MAAREVIAARQDQALKHVREILVKHQPEAEQRLEVYTPTPGGVPNSYK